MLKLLKLILIYFASQILGSLAVTPLGLMYAYLTHSELEDVNGIMLIPAMLVGFLILLVYLWKRGYLKDDGRLYSSLSGAYLTWSVVLGASAIVLITTLMELLPSLPDWMGANFKALQSGWPGIWCIVFLGPLMEECFFRGALTKELLHRYRPATAILLSGLCFGIVHINPAQVVPACLFGFLLAWLYYRTGSLIPGILIHVLNNGFSVWMTRSFPEADKLSQLMPHWAYSILLGVTALAAMLSFCMLRGWMGKEDRIWKNKNNNQI